MATKEQQERDLKTIQFKYQVLNLEALFIEDKVTFLQNDKNFIFLDEEVARIIVLHWNINIIS